MNEAEGITIKETRDEAIQLSVNVKAKCNEETKIMFDANNTLRKVINRCQRWEFTGTLQDVNGDIVPKELYRFCIWPTQGPKTDKRRKEKTKEVKKHTILSSVALWK